MPIDPRYWQPSVGRRVEFDDATRCEYLEVLRYPSLAKSEKREGVLDNATLLGWYTRDLCRGDPEGKNSEAPSGGIRILIATCDPTPQQQDSITLSVSKEAFTTIATHISLPAEFPALIPCNHTRSLQFLLHGMTENAPSAPGFLFKIPFYRAIFFQLVLNYSHVSGVIHALLIVRKDSQALPILKTSLVEHQQYCEQPLLLPCLAAEFLIDDSDERLTTSDQRLNDLEEAMGQHEYTGRRRGDPIDLDFPATTRTLNFIGKKVGVDVVRLKCFALALEDMMMWKKEIAAVKDLNTTAEHTGHNKSIQLSMGESFINEKLGYLAGTCRVLELEAEYEEKRIRALIQVVYQFMAQKDAKVNIELAKSSAAIAKASKEDSAVMRTIAIESKKDSSSMKTIATLGMLFLPGTFIAAIFAMPVYNWDGNGDSVFKNNFRYYWAITVPLTVVVILFWAIMTLLPWKRWVSRHSSDKTSRDGIELI